MKIHQNQTIVDANEKLAKDLKDAKVRTIRSPAQDADAWGK